MVKLSEFPVLFLSSAFKIRLLLSMKNLLDFDMPFEQFIEPVSADYMFIFDFLDQFGPSVRFESPI